MNLTDLETVLGAAGQGFKVAGALVNIHKHYNYFINTVISIRVWQK